MANNIMREKFKGVKARLAVRQKQNEANEKATAPNRKSIEQMAFSLVGDKPVPKTAAFKMKLKTKKAVVKKCHDKETAQPAPVAPAKSCNEISPVIFLQDNLLKISRYIDLNALRLDITNSDNVIDFDTSACKKLCKKSINFYVEASSNPYPELLEEVGEGKLVKRYVPKGYEPFLQALFITQKNKANYEYAITFSQLVKAVERGTSKLSQVCGNLTKQQALELNLKFVEGEHFSYYVSN